MTISKKLLLTATIGLSMQFGAFARFDALQVKDEVTTILNFIPTLRQQENDNAVTTIKWLETQLDNTDWETALDNFHIIALANVITKDITIDAKIDEIQTIIANKNAENARQAQERLEMQYRHRKETIFSIGGMTALLIAMGYVMSQCHPICRLA